jgi:hypothetical protein
LTDEEAREADEVAEVAEESDDKESSSVTAEAASLPEKIYPPPSRSITKPRLEAITIMLMKIKGYGEREGKEPLLGNCAECETSRSSTSWSLTSTA